MKRVILSLSIMALLASFVAAAEKQPIEPTAKDKCPVCGMFVAKYPDFLAQIIFKDGSYALFDGPKDFFKYYLEMKKYNPGKAEPDIEAVYMTDYYSLTPVDGRKAYYVIGSDIYGPMGKELIPFADKADAEQFMKDHQGKSVLNFQDVSTATLQDMN